MRKSLIKRPFLPNLFRKNSENELQPRPESGTVGQPALGWVRAIVGATVWFGVFGEIIPRRFFMLFRSKIVTFNINYAETHQRLRLGDWALSHEKSLNNEVFLILKSESSFKKLITVFLYQGLKYNVEWDIVWLLRIFENFGE